MSNYRLGLARDKKGDSDGAIAAYFSAISCDNAPEDVKAMALYNRALLFDAQGNHSKAAADLNAIMVMPTSVRGVTDAARRRLERLQRRQDAAPARKRNASPRREWPNRSFESGPAEVSPVLRVVGSSASAFAIVFGLDPISRKTQRSE